MVLLTNHETAPFRTPDISHLNMGTKSPPFRRRPQSGRRADYFPLKRYERAIEDRLRRAQFTHVAKELSSVRYHHIFYCRLDLRTERSSSNS
jgi:hypothetical protein